MPRDCGGAGYEARGARVQVAAECPEGTCAYTCGSSGTCDSDWDAITCESCRDMVEYFTYVCQNCFVNTNDETMGDAAGAYAFECWGEQK